MSETHNEYNRGDSPIDIVNGRVTELKEEMEKRIAAIHVDIKEHCTNSDLRLRNIEAEAIKADVLLEQFVKMQQKQSESNDKLNDTLIKLNSTVAHMEDSLTVVFKRTDKASSDIVDLQKETAVIPELKSKIETNEKKHQIDLRDVENQIVAGDVKTNWRKPALVAGGVASGGGLIFLLVKIIELLQQLLGSGALVK